MKKLKWIILSLAALLTVGGVTGGLVLKSWLAGVLTRESFIRQLESQWNCRADISSLTVSLWSAPARIEIKNLVLAAPDADTKAGTPIASRKPITASAALAGADRLVLEVDLADLIHQRLHVKRLTLSSVRARNDISDENGNLLANLFSKPQPPTAASTAKQPETPAPTPTAQAAPAPVVAPSPTATPAPTTVVASNVPPPVAAEPAKPAHHASFQAKELGLSVVIDEARLEQGSFHQNNHRAHDRIDITDFNLAISQVDVDPADLAHHNECKIDLTAHLQYKGRARVGESDQDVKKVDLTLETSSTLHPLNVDDGEFNPSGTLDLLIKKDSVLGGYGTFGDMAGKDKGMDRLKKNFGIDVSNVTAGGPVQQDIHTTVKINGSRLEFTNDTPILFPDYTLTLGIGSWLDSAEDAQQLHLQFVPSDTLSKTVLDGVSTKFGADFAKSAIDVFNDGHGHLAFDIDITGKLSNPKMQMGGQDKIIKNLLKGLDGGGLLKGLIK